MLPSPFQTICREQPDVWQMWFNSSSVHSIFSCHATPQQISFCPGMKREVNGKKMNYETSSKPLVWVWFCLFVFWLGTSATYSKNMCLLVLIISMFRNQKSQVSTQAENFHVVIQGFSSFTLKILKSRLLSFISLSGLCLLAQTDLRFLVCECQL